MDVVIDIVTVIRKKNKLWNNTLLTSVPSETRFVKFWLDDGISDLLWSETNTIEILAGNQQ